MASYYFTKFESMIERWQSKRKTIKISSQLITATVIETKARKPKQQKLTVATTRRKKMSRAKFVELKLDNNQEDNKENDNCNYENENENNQEQNVVMVARNSAAAKKLITQKQVEVQSLICDIDERPRRFVFASVAATSGATNTSTATATTTTTTSLLYVANIFGLLLSLLLLTTSQHTTQLALADVARSRPLKVTGGGGASGPQITVGRILDSPVARSLGISLIEQLASSTRPRWTLVPGDGVDPLNSDRQPSRWAQRNSAIQRLVNRISSRIGARNSIRVHNAFRDFAWRILSSLSMPTPVIYELRRQHLYSPEDDLKNDSLFNRNTTKTIRTKRLLQRKARSSDDIVNRASSEEDEEDEPDNLVDRVRSRLDDLISLSRRSLFGRVIRVPALFPFKRQEGEQEEQELHKGTTSLAGSRRRRLSRRRRKKESDRQMISINGKQYYVNDNGELKELNDEQSD